MLRAINQLNKKKTIFVEFGFSIEDHNSEYNIMRELCIVVMRHQKINYRQYLPECRIMSFSGKCTFESSVVYPTQVLIIDTPMVHVHRCKDQSLPELLSITLI